MTLLYLKDIPMTINICGCNDMLSEISFLVPPPVGGAEMKTDSVDRFYSFIISFSVLWCMFENCRNENLKTL